MKKNDLQRKLQKLTGKLPEGVTGTRSVTELKEGELRTVNVGGGSWGGGGGGSTGGGGGSTGW